MDVSQFVFHNSEFRSPSYLRTHIGRTLLAGFFLIACLIQPAQAQPALLQAGSASGLAGAEVDIEVTINTGLQGISTFQFDLELPPGLEYISTNSGAAAAAAGKSVTASETVGGVRVLIFGLNLDLIGSGAVAIIRTAILAGTPPDTYQIGIGNITASDPEGALSPVEGVNGSLVVLAPPDTTPPVISEVAGVEVTYALATILWQTNEPASSQVDFGITSGYGSSSVLNPARVTSHSVVLEELEPNTLYHFRVKSADEAENVALSGDFTFQTLEAPDTTPPVISDVSSSDVLSDFAAITWTTDEDADSQIDFGKTTAYGKSTDLNPNRVKTHQQTVEGLEPNSLYHYRVKSKDAIGNLAVSGDYTFTTPQASDDTPPVISNVSGVGATTSSITITWTTDEPADTRVEYGTTIAYDQWTTLNETLVVSHSQTLTGLQPDTLYHYKVMSRDEAGNQADSGDYTFTTAAEDDTTPPKINGITVTNVSSRSATVNWTTDEQADSLIEYRTGTESTRTTRPKKGMVTEHSQKIGGLEANTQYCFRVRSRDAAGNVAISEEYDFQTKEARKPKRKLFYPQLGSKSNDTAMQSDGSPSVSNLEELEYTGIALANLSSEEAELTFTAYDPTGLEISGEQIINPADWIMTSGEQLPIIDHQLFGDVLSSQGPVGWIKVESTVIEMTGFTLMFNSSLSSMDGADAAVVPSSNLILPEINTEGFNNVHISNPNEEAITVIFALVEAHGGVHATAERVIDVNGTVAESVTDLFPDAVPAGSDYIRVMSGKGVISYESFGKASQNIAVLAGQDASGGAATIYSPQYVIGGTWRSTLSVVNLDSSPGFLTFRMISDDGGQVGATRTLPIGGNGKVYIADQLSFTGADENPIQGYVQITSNGVRLTGSVVFGDRENESFATALPLVTEPESVMIFSHIASDATYFTGLALLNPNDSQVTATIDLYRSDGTLEASTMEIIPAKRRISRLVTEYFPELIGVDRSSGYIRVTADGGVASFALFGTHDLSVLSAIPAQRAP